MKINTEFWDARVEELFHLLKNYELSYDDVLDAVCPGWTTTNRTSLMHWLKRGWRGRINFLESYSYLDPEFELNIFKYFYAPSHPTPVSYNTAIQLAEYLEIYSVKEACGLCGIDRGVFSKNGHNS